MQLPTHSCSRQIRVLGPKAEGKVLKKKEKKKEGEEEKKRKRSIFGKSEKKKSKRKVQSFKMSLSVAFHKPPPRDFRCSLLKKPS